MNCRSVSKILPGLAASELDTATAGRAMEHIAGCAFCSRELAGYERTLTLLAEPRPMTEPPPTLDMLRLPDARPRPVFRPVLAAMAAGILLLALCIPWLLRKPVVKPSVSPRPVTEVASAVGNEGAMGTGELGTANRGTLGNRGQRTGNRWHGRSSVRLGRGGPGHRRWRVRARPVLVRRDGSGDERIVRPKVLLLVACSMETPSESSIEIESVNRATRTVTRFSSRNDDSSTEQTVETESTPDTDDGGRVQ